MKRITWYLAAFLTGLSLVLASPVAAAPSKATGTVALNETDVHYGDTVTFTVTTDAPRSDVRIVCVHAAGSSFGFTNIADAGTYVTDTTRMTAPNWPESPAECTATLRDIQADKHGFKRAVELDAISFEVAA